MRTISNNKKSQSRKISENGKIKAYSLPSLSIGNKKNRKCRIAPHFIMTGSVLLTIHFILTKIHLPSVATIEELTESQTVCASFLSHCMKHINLFDCRLTPVFDYINNMKIACSTKEQAIQETTL